MPGMFRNLKRRIRDWRMRRLQKKAHALRAKAEREVKAAEGLQRSMAGIKEDAVKAQATARAAGKESDRRSKDTDKLLQMDRDAEREMSRILKGKKPKA